MTDAAQPARRSRAFPKRLCRWCATEYRPKRGHATHFCSATCRTACNNHRKKWGAILYDLAMGRRAERQRAEAAGLDRTHFDRLLMHLRHMDERHERKSWRDPFEVMAEVGPMMNATTHRY